MTNRFIRTFFGALLASTLGLQSGPSSLLHAQGTPKTARATLSAQLAKATFDTAWATIGATHYDSGFSASTWETIRGELTQRAESARYTSELRSVIGEMLARLGESHYALIPAEVAHSWISPPDSSEIRPTAPPGDAGLELRLVDGRVLVSSVAPGGAGDRAGVHAGWVVERIGERDVTPFLAAFSSASNERERRASLLQVPMRVSHLMDGDAGSLVTVVFRDSFDRRITRSLDRRAVRGELVQFGFLPAMAVLVEHERLSTSTGCTGVIRFNVWMMQVASAFDRAMNALRDCDGIVLDLRGNLGGVAAMVMGISGHFLDREVVLGTMRMRNNQLRFVSNPRRTTAEGAVVSPFAGRLAILIDPQSASTSEIFASGMQQVGRARLFGEISAGQALPALLHRLPNGDVLMHVIADFTTPDGQRIEGRGSIPDEHVALTRSNLLAGIDAPLRAARRWIEIGHGLKTSP